MPSSFQLLAGNINGVPGMAWLDPHGLPTALVLPGGRTEEQIAPAATSPLDFTLIMPAATVVIESCAIATQVIAVIPPGLTP